MEIDGIFIDKCIEKNGNFLIPILQDIQESHNYLPEEMLKTVSEKLQIPLIDIYGVSTFYKSFSLTPKGENIITVCLGTACYVHGGERMVDVISRELNIKSGETTKNKKFTLETVNCLGCCAIGPVVVINDEYFREMTPKKTINLLRSIAKGEK